MFKCETCRRPFESKKGLANHKRKCTQINSNELSQEELITSQNSNFDASPEFLIPSITTDDIHIPLTSTISTAELDHLTQTSDPINTSIAPTTMSENNIPISTTTCLSGPINTYQELQESYFTATYGSSEAIKAQSMDDFLQKTECSNDINSSLMLKLYEFGMQAKLSRNNGDALLNLIKMFNPQEKVPATWKTVTRNVRDKKVKEFKYTEKNVPWPVLWNMSNWKGKGNVPEEIIIRVRDPLEMLAYQCIDPILQFGWKNQIRYSYTQQFLEGTTTQLLGELMTTPWARDNESYIRNNKNKDGILLTCLLYSDGVSLGKTNNTKTNSVMGTCANFDFELITKDIAKFSLGNIPEVSEVSKATLIQHLVENGFTETGAKKEIQTFTLLVEQSFWKEVVRPFRRASDNGAYMHILGLGLRVVFPLFTSPVGDDPALKRQCLVYEGHSNYPCIKCEYPLRGGVLYNPDIHKNRNANEIIADCKRAEDIINHSNKGRNKKVGNNTGNVIQKLQSKGIHPMCNAFHEKDVMGINSSIYDVTSDTFHVFLAGIMKTGTIAICTIVDCISFHVTKEYKNNNGIMDARLNLFWNVPKMKHLSWTVFRKGLSELATKKSKFKKKSHGGSGGGYRSSHFSCALLQLYFAVVFYFLFHQFILILLFIRSDLMDLYYPICQDLNTKIQNLALLLGMCRR
jgi:hypothetical protein